MSNALLPYFERLHVLAMPKRNPNSKFSYQSLHLERWDACEMQVNSEFQAFKHIDIRSRGEMARAMKSLEATLALQPTLILTNSLPCSLDVIVWQARQPLQLCSSTVLDLKLVVKDMKRGYAYD